MHIKIYCKKEVENIDFKTKFTITCDQRLICVVL